MKIVLASGGYDPLHSGHIAYLRAARQLGDYLIVGVNSDAWLQRKKGRSFMPLIERATIVDNLSVVDEVVAFDDTYDADDSCVKFIEDILKNEPEAEVIFANGGDRTKTNIPEMRIENSRLSFQFDVGGDDKKNSSSWILQKWKQLTTTRAWGTYTVLDSTPDWVVKELAFWPHHALSDQRHSDRNEHWHVVQGEVRMKLEQPDGARSSTIYRTGDSINIPAGTWHKAINETEQTARVIEVWLRKPGGKLDESDIERRD